LDRQKKKIMWTILIVAVIQMPGLALTPGINQIKTTAFSGMSLGMVQTALACSSLAQPVAAFSVAALINRRLVTKKAIIIFGLCLLASDGLLAILFHTEFWHLIMLSLVLGISTGCFLSNMFGIMFDSFDDIERQAVAGYQTSFINAGGIMMSLLGGFLATLMWYGGYLVLFVGLPAAVLVYFTIPGYKVPAPENGDKKGSGKLNPKIYYYCVLSLLFMMSYSVCGANISTHIAGLGDSSVAGIAIAFLMGGGVFSGIFFGRLSNKVGDYAMSFALCSVFVGYMMLSVFTRSLVLTFVAVFLTGMSLSIMIPRCIYMVSTLATDKSISATATALVSVVAPSSGSFLSPIIFTNITTALFGNSTAARYRFVGFFVLAVAIAIAAITTAGKKKASREVKT